MFEIVGAIEGFSVTLECFSEAHPTSLNYWTKGDGQMIHDSKKYRYVSFIIHEASEMYLKVDMIFVYYSDNLIFM